MLHTVSYFAKKYATLLLLALIIIAIGLSVVFSPNNHLQHQDDTNNARIAILTSNTELIAQAQTILPQGKLATDSGDFLYLKVSNDYIEKLYTLLFQSLSSSDRNCLLPAYNRSRGTHISLFLINRSVVIPTEQLYNFRVTGLEKITLMKKNQGRSIGETWYALTVELSPNLMDYLKTVKPNFTFRYPPHISIAIAKENPDHTCVHPTQSTVNYSSEYSKEPVVAGSP